MTARRAALALAAGLVALAAGCSADPERAEGRVAYRDKQRTGKPTVLVAVTTAKDKDARPGDTRITREEMAALLKDLEAIGLFELPGLAEAPPTQSIPPGFIGVDTDRRKFYIGFAQLRTPEEGPVFSRAAFRIIDAAQHGGLHIGLEK